MKDIYENEYELYSGRIYISKNKKFGNVAVHIPNCGNNGLYVIYYGELNKNNIEKAVIAMGWQLEDWI